MGPVNPTEEARVGPRSPSRTTPLQRLPPPYPHGSLPYVASSNVVPGQGSQGNSLQGTHGSEGGGDLLSSGESRCPNSNSPSPCMGDSRASRVCSSAGSWRHNPYAGRVPGSAVEAPSGVPGKGVLFRGPYTVHTLLPVRQAKVAANLLAPLRSHQRLFPTPTPTHKAVLAALRARNLTLEVRSLRRGALQTLALTTPEDLLLNFSGHTNVKTLRRYLGWGRILGTVAQATTRAAIALLPTTEAAPFQRGQVTLLRRPDPPPYPTSPTPGRVSLTPAPTTPGTR